LMEKLDAELQRMTGQDDVLGRLAPWMGSYTAAVIVTMCDPQKYASASQLEKACGLNMRESSSGEHRGRVAITKRGPGVVRQVLYLFALRTIQHCAMARAWYKQRRGYTEGSKSRAVVALMRKLVKAMFHVARGDVFDPTKLFDKRRLEAKLTAPSPEPSKIGFAPRVMPRAIAGRKRGGASSASTST
jgi:transposase